MAFEVIPWRDFSDFSQTVRLSGELYTLRARWNTVNEFWTLDIYDRNGTALLLGQKIVFNTDILARYQDPRLPPGKIFAVDAGNGSQNISTIGRDDIGTNVLIVYEAP